MKENKAYKLNKEKQPAEEKGKYLYYFYNDQKLSCIDVDENQWEKLVALDTENNDFSFYKPYTLREKFNYILPNHILYDLRTTFIRDVLNAEYQK